MMKRFVFILAILFIFNFSACTNSETVKTPQVFTEVSTPEIKIEHEHTAQETSENELTELKEAYTAYYEILQGAVDEYGLAEIPYGVGVHYAKLINFDDDGIPELMYTLVRAFDEDNFKGETILWVYSYSDGYAEPIFWIGQPFFGTTFRREPRYVFSDDGKAYFVIVIGGMGSFHSTYYTIEDNEWVEVLKTYIRVCYDTYDELFFIDEIEVDEQTFYNTLADKFGISTNYMDYYKMYYTKDNPNSVTAVHEVLAELRETYIN
jgi:hypothetical protein